MKEETRQELKKAFHLAVMPAMYGALFIVIAFVIRAQIHDGLSTESQLTIVMGGGIIALIGVTVFIHGYDLARIQNDLNEMKKQP